MCEEQDGERRPQAMEERADNEKNVGWGPVREARSEGPVDRGTAGGLAWHCVLE
ncbi:MAG: hypothetical protein WA747_10460 [Steroidobacteraceae bacterium]